MVMPCSMHVSPAAAWPSYQPGWLMTPFAPGRLHKFFPRYRAARCRFMSFGRRLGIYSQEFGSRWISWSAWQPEIAPCSIPLGTTANKHREMNCDGQGLAEKG